MNTPAHVIFSLAILGRPRAIKYAVSIAVGALLPDLFMIVFYGFEKLTGVPEQVIWEEHYFLPVWQNLFDSANSLPLLAMALAVMIFKRHTAWALLFASMIIHCLLDFSVHHDDSHRHFFPFSDFRFQSPVSYWNPAYYGHIVGALELILFVWCSAFLWCGEQKAAGRFYKLTRLRWVILITAAAYAVFFKFVATTWLNM